MSGRQFDIHIYRDKDAQLATVGVRTRTASGKWSDDPYAYSYSWEHGGTIYRGLRPTVFTLRIGRLNEEKMEYVERTWREDGNDLREVSMTTAKCKKPVS